MNLAELIIVILFYIFSRSYEFNEGMFRKEPVKMTNLIINLKESKRKVVWFNYQDVEMDQIKIITLGPNIRNETDFYDNNNNDNNNIDNNNNNNINNLFHSYYYYEIPLFIYPNNTWIEIKFKYIIKDVFELLINGHNITEKYLYVDTVSIITNGTVNLSFTDMMLILDPVSLIALLCSYIVCWVLF